MVTHKKSRGASGRVSVPELRPLPQKPTGEDKREVQRLLRNDAAIAVLSLNESTGAPHKRLLAIRNDLDRLKCGAERLAALDAEIGQEIFPHGAGGPSRPGSARHLNLAGEFKALWSEMEELFSSVNLRLSRYIFRPAAQFSLMADQWRFGVLPDEKKGSFQIRVDGCTVTESDAVIAMVRLNITGELYKVHLCDMCRSRWRVSDRKIDRFCGDKCREAFYLKSPNYRETKKKNQREYRKRLKEAQANAIA